MSIEKKSLISTLKTTKKANAVSSEVAKPSNVTSKMMTAGMKRNTAVTYKAKRADVTSTRKIGVSSRRKADLRRATTESFRAAPNS